MKRLLISFASLLFIAINGGAQLLTWTPDFPKDNDNIVITMDATRGNLGLNNYANPNDIYVHTGVITNQSTGPTNWRYVRNFGFPDNQVFNTQIPQLKATSLGNNKYSFSINNIRTYYGVPAGETILRIAIVFRNGAGTTVQRNADASDMYVPVYDNNLAVRFTVPAFQPLYIPIPETINKQVGDNITITALANKVCTLRILLNGTEIQSAINATSITATPVLTTSGNQTVVVEGDDGSGIKTQTFQFFVASAPIVAPLPAGVRDGINYETGNTSAVLVLYAPNKNRISVIGEFPGSNWVEQTNYVMNKTPDGNYWWLRVTGLTPGTEYAFQYLVNGTFKVAEPYSEKILDPFNDGFITVSTYPNLKPYPAGLTSGIVSVLQTNPPAYTWANNTFARPDKRNLVIYELLLRDYIAAHDWKTLRDTLSYLKRLGVNAIEVMPFNEFEGNESWGYNPDFYFAPDKYYGPKNTLKEFIDSCHSKGIAVFMDMTLNHTTGLNPLAALYWNSSTNQPAADNPWLNVTAKHPFNVFNDFNHESMATRNFSSRVMEFWLLEYKLDGFRFDLSKGFTQTNSCTTPNCDTPAEVNAMGSYDQTRIDIWKRYYDTMQLKSPGSIAILEHFAANNEEIVLSNYGMLLWGNNTHQFQEASMGYLGDSNFEGILHTVRGWTNPYLVGYMESHDEERIMYKNAQFGNSSGSYNIRDLNTSLRRVEQTAAFFFTMPGPKMIWEFGEMGYDFSINRCTDGTVNDACRLSNKPIRWDYMQTIERRRLYDVYSSLNKLRFHPLFKDVFTANNINLTRNLGNSVAFKSMIIRSAMDTSILCVVGNFDVMPQTGNLTFPVAGTWYDYLLGTTFTATGAPQPMTLQPGEYHVYVNRNVVNAVVTPVTGLPIPGRDLLVGVYPNPVEDNSVIKLDIPENGKVLVDLWNAVGHRIGNIHSGFLSKGNHQLSFPPLVANLPPGNYLLKVQLNNRSSTIKLVLP